MEYLINSTCNYANSENKESGFSLIETLVSILVLGLIVTFSLVFFDKIYSNPQILLKGEALRLAELEMSYCINNKIATDTVYMNSGNNLMIERRVSDNKGLLNAEVKILPINQVKELISLEVSYIK